MAQRYGLHMNVCICVFINLAPAITFDSSIGNIRDNRARFRRMSC